LFVCLFFFNLGRLSQNTHVENLETCIQIHEPVFCVASHEMFFICPSSTREPSALPHPRCDSSSLYPDILLACGSAAWYNSKNMLYVSCKSEGLQSSFSLTLVNCTVFLYQLAFALQGCVTGHPRPMARTRSQLLEPACALLISWSSLGSVGSSAAAVSLPGLALHFGWTQVCGTFSVQWVKPALLGWVV
jgi:hypothetical protein